MSRLILAICPSNQDRNPVVGGGSEMTHIMPLAEAVVSAAVRFGIVARLFTPQPESRDYPTGSLSGLIAQQREAANWIAATRQPGDLTVSLNLHSDSGSYRHCGYYYDGRGTVSEWLGEHWRSRSPTGLGGSSFSDYSSYAPSRGGIGAARCLPRATRNGGPHDAWRRGGGAGPRRADRAYADGDDGRVRRDRGGPPLNTAELEYAVWSLQRLEHGETPLDRDAFVRHLDAWAATPPTCRAGAGRPNSPSSSSRPGA